MGLFHEFWPDSDAKRTFRKFVSFGAESLVAMFNLEHRIHVLKFFCHLESSRKMTFCQPKINWHGF